MPEITLQLPHSDLKLAAQQFGNPRGPKLLALHGWLDNSESFQPLFAYLQACHVVAIDLPGHGFSQHLPPGAEYHYVDYVRTVAEVAQVLQWDHYAVMGHSLGAGIAPLVAGTFPEHISHLILIEGLGPLTCPANDAPQRLRQALHSRWETEELPPEPYPSLADVVRLRQKVGDLSATNAQLLMLRNLKQTPQGWIWRTDARLKRPTLLRLTEEQVAGFLRAVRCPTLLIQGDRGFLAQDRSWDYILDRCQWLTDLTTRSASGGHHVHMDSPAEVAEHISRFLNVPIRYS